MLRVHAHSRNLQELMAATLFVRCLSNFQAVVLLCERGMIPEARIALRALIEAMFILAAISKEYRLAVAYAREDELQRLKAIQRYKQLHNTPPPGFTEQQINALESELRKHIDEKSIKKLTTKEWSQEAGLHSWYLSPYFDLSESVHAKTREMETYVVKSADNEVTEFRWGPSDEGLRLVLGTTVESQDIVLGCVARVFKLEMKTELEAFGARLREMNLDDLQE